MTLLNQQHSERMAVEIVPLSTIDEKVLMYVKMETATECLTGDDYM